MRRKSRKILQRKRLTATQPNYSLAFTKWLGRALTRHEKQVIMTLEQMRQRGETVRIHIHDHYGVDSREILTEYLRWLMELEPIEEGAFVCITKKEAKERSRHFRKKPLTSGHWKVDSLRSFTVKFALMLDITRYDWLKLDIGALAPVHPHHRPKRRLHHPHRPRHVLVHPAGVPRPLLQANQARSPRIHRRSLPRPR